MAQIRKCLETIALCLSKHVAIFVHGTAKLALLMKQALIYLLDPT